MTKSCKGCKDKDSKGTCQSMIFRTRFCKCIDCIVKVTCRNKMDCDMYIKSLQEFSEYRNFNNLSYTSIRRPGKSRTIS